MSTLTTSLQELLAQQKALDEKISHARQAERNSAIAQAKELVTTYALTASEVFATGSRKSKPAKNKVEPKYRDPKTGSTWTGRGKAPAWIANQDRSAFAIQ
jgi:DNA-binding protein H-NS